MSILEKTSHSSIFENMAYIYGKNELDELYVTNYRENDITNTQEDYQSIKDGINFEDWANDDNNSNNVNET